MSFDSPPVDVTGKDVSEKRKMKAETMKSYRIDSTHGTETIHATLTRLGLTPSASYVVRARNATAALKRAAKTLERDVSTLYVAWSGD